MRYDHYIWDWNGTLFNDVGVCTIITNEFLTKAGKEELTVDRYRELSRHPARDFYVDLGFDPDEEKFLIFCHEFHERYKDLRFTAALHDQAEEVLTMVLSASRSQAVLSAHPQPLLDEILGHLKLTHYFTKIMGHADSRAGSKILQGQEYVREVGIPAERILVLGDSDHDAHVAEAIGADCVLICHGLQARTRLEKTGKPVVNTLAEALEHMRE